MIYKCAAHLDRRELQPIPSSHQQPSLNYHTMTGRPVFAALRLFEIYILTLSILIQSSLAAQPESSSKVISHSTKVAQSPLSTTSPSYPSCYNTTEFPFTVVSIVLVILGLQLVIWSGWILVEKRSTRSVSREV